VSLSFPLLVFAGLSLATLLWVLLAFGLLTIGLYLLKLRRRRVEVPFLPLWESLLVQRQASALRSRLQRLLSLLLSLLLVGALVFALGDPRSEKESKGGRSLVVLVDVSASMGQLEGQRSRLSVAQARVEEWLLSLSGADQLLLVELGARPRPVEAFTNDRARLREGLAKLRVLDVSSDLGAGLRLARDALRGRPQAEIILVSDGAHESFPEPLAKLPKLSFESVAKKQDKPQGNLSITGFSARRYPSARDRFEILVQIENSPVSSAEVELSIHAATEQGDRGPLLDVQRLTLSQGESFYRTYDDLDRGEEGLIAEVRRVDGGNEPFTADNIARTLLAPLSPIRVLVVGGANNFLEAALLVDSGLIVERASASDYPPRGRFDVTIFDGVFPRRDPKTGPALYLGAPDEGGEYPVKVDARLTLFGFDTWKKDSAVFRLIDPYNVQVLEGHALVPGGDDVVLAKSGKNPILISGERPEGRFLALGFKPTKSDFVLRAVWPLFILNVLEELSPRDPGETLLGLQTGRLVRAPAPVHTGRAILRGPQTGPGEIQERSVFVDEGRVAFFGQGSGFYEVISEGKSTRFSASLLSDAESRLPPQEELKIPGTTVGEVGGMVPRAEREPWVWLLLIVAGVSFVEWWTYHRRLTV
jgi:hypothetical protein